VEEMISQDGAKAIAVASSVSWLIFATIGSGRPSLPKFANWARAKRFSLTKSAVNPDGARQGMRNEHLGKARLVVENTDDGRLLQPHDLAFGHCGSCSHAPRLSVRHPSPQNSSGPKTATTASRAAARAAPAVRLRGTRTHLINKSTDRDARALMTNSYLRAPRKIASSAILCESEL
jgi:hypothetical protein